MKTFAERLLAWFDDHGRKDLPWQSDRNPYRVWVSEVMLQQTQVQTVIPYFERFMARFPTVQALADAPTDDVLHHWSGLGYYARARNLQKAARTICEHHDGDFPADIEGLTALAGIGRSTAGAILSLASDIRAPILDGNVKRVLARHDAVEGYPGQSAVAKRLWSLADELTPHHRVADYTQAIMDLGATVCVRSRPLCLACPVSEDCEAKRQGLQDALPTRKPKKAVPHRSCVFLLLENEAGDVLLEQRPPSGIWGGLWGFPEAEHPLDAAGAATQCEDRFGLAAESVTALTPIAHGFTHYKLDIYPMHCRVRSAGPAGSIMEGQPWVWYNARNPTPLGLAAPVSELIAALEPVGGTDS